MPSTIRGLRGLVRVICVAVIAVPPAAVSLAVEATVSPVAQTQAELEQLAARFPITLETRGAFTPLTIDPYAAEDPAEVWNDWRMENKKDGEPPLMVILAHRMWAFHQGLTEVGPDASLTCRSGVPVKAPWTSELLSAAANIAPAAPTLGEEAETFLSVDPNNPQHIVGSSNHRLLFDSTCTSALSASGVTLNSNGGQELYWSTDGGVTWSHQCAPWHSGSAYTLTTANGTSPFTFQSSDPSISWDTSGNAYVLTLPWWQDASGSLSGNSVNLVKWDASTNTWSAVATPESYVACVTSGCDTIDKTELIIDTTSGQAFSHTNRLYAAWTHIFLNLQFRYRMRIAFSDPPYTSWTITDFAPGGTVETGNSVTRLSSSMAVAADGTVYLAWDRNVATGSNQRISKSTNGGTTWSASVVMSSTATLTDFAANTKIAAQDTRGIALLPQIAVDACATSLFKGRLYESYTDFHTGVTSGNDVDVYVRRSTDGGSTWATVATFTGVASGTSQFEPATTVDQSTGLVTVAWYDTSVDPTLNRKTQIYASQSADGGTTWSAQQLMTDSGANFSHHDNFLDENSTDMPNVTTLHHYQYGEYMGASSSGGNLWLSWTDSRNWLTENAADTEYEDIGTFISCTPPGAPAISSVADVNVCASSGVTVTYTAGSGATRHDLLKDGSVVVTGYVSGAVYVPGDNVSHTYVVRAVNGTCTTDSAGVAGTDVLGTTCNDGNACTQNDTCVGGSCVGGAAVVCDDGNVCNGLETCNPASGCVAGTPLVCNDGNLCTDDACNPASGCVFTNNTAPCNDGNACTQIDTCQSGVCAGGNPVVCSALDSCHDAGICAPATGLCSNPAKVDGTSCNDANACTQTDTCQSGVCTGGQPIVCSALDQCHDAGVCAPATGVCSNPAKVDGATCSDGNACTQTDTCQSGVCAGGNPVVCSALDQCHDAGVCAPATGVCSNPAKVDGTSCSDGNACTQTDTCQSGVCAGGNPVVCSALDQCHDAGLCAPATGVCSNPAKVDGTSCNDGNACTQTDTCQSGACAGGNPVVCSALDQCHDAGLCAPATGVCSNPAKVDGTSCNDGNACTQTDTCQSGACAGGNPVVCSALDQCHDAGLCAPATGVCSNPARVDGTSCSDGNACTQTDTCQSGVCSGGNPVVCSALDQCHDAGVCAPATGVCSNPAKVNGTSCSDGNVCTQTDTCQSGVCSGGNPVVCSALDQCHDAGVCAPATGVCSNPAKADGASCSDGNACTQTDTCQSGSCVGSGPVVCTASDACHMAGSCDPQSGACSNPAAPDGTSCNDGNACTQSDSCLAGTCAGTNPVVCTAADACHAVGTCNPGTGACSNPAAADGTPCGDAGTDCTNQDTCLTGACHDNGFKLSGTACGNPATTTCDHADTCNGAGFCQPNLAADGTLCSDGNPCTTGDRCATGVCQAGPGTLNCNDGNACTDDSCSPSAGCLHASNTAPCSDGNACTIGDVCGGGTCHPGTGTLNCNDNNACTDDSCSPISGCVNAANTAACDDGNPCTVGDACAAGACHSGTPITAPPETQGVVAAADKATYAWSAASNAAQYDVVRGSTGAFPVGPGGSDEVCFDNLSGPTLTDPAVPAQGAGFWYLSRGENACGIGTFGNQSNGSARTTTTCP